MLTEGSWSGATVWGTLLIGGACLAWGIDNNLSQRLSLRDPLQIALLKAIGASGPMLLLALAGGQSLPAWPALFALLAIGGVGYGLSIWLDLLALRHLGAARESVVFATAPFVGVLFSMPTVTGTTRPAVTPTTATTIPGMIGAEPTRNGLTGTPMSMSMHRSGTSMLTSVMCITGMVMTA